MSEFELGEQRVGPGEKKIINISVARLYDFTEMRLPVRVIHGKYPGPVLFVCAAIHGDEINGVEIIRRLLRHKILNQLRGTLIAVPIVNVYGFNARARYLPDRRDLNRCFPGSKEGSLGSRLAHIFLNEIVSKSTHGIDLHTGAVHRKNLPQVRAFLNDPVTKGLAQEFRAPVILDSAIRDGSLREAAVDRGIPMLVYETGEALRFDEKGIQMGVRGILNVMRKIGLLEMDEALPSLDKSESHIAKTSYWIRAPQSGTLIKLKRLGSEVKKGERIGYITDPFGQQRVEVTAPHGGLIIGASMLPLVNRGDAIFHQAVFEDIDSVMESVELFNEDLIDSQRTAY